MSRTNLGSRGCRERRCAGVAAVGYGIDDLTLGFDMTGSGCLRRLNETDGVMTRRGKMLGHRASWGQWSHLLGRSVSFWKADTNRLYVQAKLAADRELCRPTDVSSQVRGLMERMAIVGLVSFEEPWVTRVDVAVDATCGSADGKLLLDALEAARLPNGWRTASVGQPRSTVYFKARGSENVLARAYCRNLKLREGLPYGKIRLEAEHRFDPREVMLSEAERPEFAEGIWRGRYSSLAARVVRLEREAQAVEIAERVARGELTYSQGERLSMFLDLERLGLARTYYPKAAYADRRRLAARLGYSTNDPGDGGLEVELSELLSAYVAAVDAGGAAGAARPAAAPAARLGAAATPQPEAVAGAV